MENHNFDNSAMDMLGEAEASMDNIAAKLGDEND